MSAGEQAMRRMAAESARMIARRAPATSEVPIDPAWTARSDEQLVELCLAGQTSAFAPIVERHRRRVYGVCHRFTGSHEDASDLTQEAFVRAYRALATFRRGSALSTWLYRIAVNICLNHVSARTPRCEGLAAAEIADSGAEGQDEAVLRAERARNVREAIARLPRKQRATLLLRVYEERSHQEIAEILGSSVGTVKANLFHALRNLKRLLEATRP